MTKKLLFRLCLLIGASLLAQDWGRIRGELARRGQLLAPAEVGEMRREYEAWRRPAFALPEAREKNDGADD